MKKEDEMISTNGVMYKIKKFFKNLFKKKEVVEEKKEEEKQETSFDETIAIKKDEERERLLELQKRFREGKLNPEDVTEEDIDKLTELYNEQIEALNKQIEEDTAAIEKCNREIEEYKKKKI